MSSVSSVPCFLSRLLTSSPPSPPPLPSSHVLVPLPQHAGIIGRLLLDPSDALKSYRICLGCVGVKVIALFIFIFWGLWLSCSFTILMTLIWTLRALRFRKIASILESDSTMEQYNLMNNGVV